MPSYDRRRQPADPTPDEILELAALIRQDWSEREHRIRAGFNPDVDRHWRLPRGRTGVAVQNDAV